VVVHALDVLGLAAVGLLGAMLASGLTDRNEAEFLGLTVSIESSQSYLWVTAVIAGFFMAKSVIGTALLRVTTLFLARVEAKSASEVARYLFSGDIGRVRSMSKGEIQWAVSSSSQIAFSSMLFAGSALITESALFLAVFTGFLFVDVSTAILITVYFIVLIVLFQLAINQRLRRLGQRMAHNSIRVNNSILDMANAFREAMVLEKRGVFLGRFDASRRRYALDWSLQRFVMGLPRFFIEAALMLGIMALIVWQFVQGTLSEGLVITGVFLAGGTRMMAAMLPLQNAITDIRIQGPQAQRAQELISRARAELAVEHGAKDSLQGQAVSPHTAPSGEQGLPVSVDAVSFSYPDASLAAVRDVNLEVKGGQFVAFVGPSGAGKTTLADLVLGVHTPNAGAVTVAGLTPEQLRKTEPGIVAYVPQNPGMVSGTIAQNVALGVEPEQIDVDRVTEVLRQAGLWDVIQGLPEGMDTSLGEQSDALSGGQIQRLGLARALYTRPRLLVLDEATSALDAETEAGIAQTIDALRGDTTLIVIAHRLSTIQHADTVFVIDEGQLIASGSFGQVRKKVPLIERYVQLMAIKDTDDEGDENLGDDDRGDQSDSGATR
jgi:ATP-binding cassette subfamily C protein